MKRIFVLLCVGFVLNIGLLRAEGPALRPEYLTQMEMPNAISVNVGYYSVENILTSLSGILFAFDPDTHETSTFTAPTVGVRYMRTISPVITAGCALHYSAFIRNAVREADNATSKQNCNNIALSAEIRFTYLRRGILKMYGSVGLGVSYWNIVEKNVEPQHGPFFNFNISPLGLRIGRQVGGFVELGLGYRGLVAAGFDIRF